jgi:hypothetical protein
MAVSPSDSSTVGRIRSSRELGRPLYTVKDDISSALLENMGEMIEFTLCGRLIFGSLMGVVEHVCGSLGISRFSERGLLLEVELGVDVR